MPSVGIDGAGGGVCVCVRERFPLSFGLYVFINTNLLTCLLKLFFKRYHIFNAWNSFEPADYVLKLF